MQVLLIAGGIFLLGFLIFFLAAKKELKDKRTILFLLFTLLVGLIVGLLFFWFHKRGIMELGNSYILAQAIFLVLGVFHVWFLYNKLFWTKRDEYDRAQDSFWPESLISLFAALALSIGTFGVLYYFIQDVAIQFWSVGFSYLLPFLLLKAIDFLQQIPLRDYKVKWFFSKRLINENEWNWANEMWVSFQVKESWDKPGMKRQAKFRILAPRNAPLGEIYRLAVREYNKQGKQIIVQDLGFEPENKGQFWWLFTLKRVWNRPHTWFPNLRYLDPNDSAMVNALRPGDLVRMQRISTGNGQQMDEVVAIGQAI